MAKVFKHFREFIEVARRLRFEAVDFDASEVFDSFIAGFRRTLGGERSDVVSVEGMRREVAAGELLVSGQFDTAIVAGLNPKADAMMNELWNPLMEGWIGSPYPWDLIG